MRNNGNFLALKLLAVSLVVAGFAHTVWGQQINVWVVSFLSPLYKGATVATRTVRDQVSFFVSLRRVASRNKELQEKVWKLQSKVLEIERLEEENERLRRQLSLSIKGEANRLSAEVTGWEPTGSENYFLIDKGYSSGLEEGMPIVYENFLVGKVVAVGSDSSRVQAITDLNFWVFAVDKDSETRTKGVVSGYMPGKLIMRKIFAGEEIQKGDVVVTSGEGGSFPSGLILGEVAQVREEGVLKEAILDLSIDLHALEEVFVY